MDTCTAKYQGAFLGIEPTNLIKEYAKVDAQDRISAFSALLDVIAEGLFLVDQQGDFVQVNSIAAKYFGSDSKTLCGASWFRQLHERYREDYEYMFLRWCEDNQNTLSHGPKEVLITRDDGTWMAADLSLTLLPSELTGDQPMIVGVVHSLEAHKAQYNELRRLASIDHLTGLANRYQLQHTLDRSWSRCLIDKLPIALILIDVDYFKQFNDQFGHVNGDKCLQKLAAIIEQSLPNNECLAARYGGEEFAVILPDHDEKAALAVGRLIQQQLNMRRFSDLGLPASFKVTVSQGVASAHNGPYRTPEALICAADTALYQAKAEGRNRIKVSD